MSGICSKHKEHEPGCRLCEAGQMVVWDEPGECGENVRHRITEDEAVRRAKAAVPYSYPSDEVALKDFISIHWAWREP